MLLLDYNLAASAIDVDSGPADILRNQPHRREDHIPVKTLDSFQLEQVSLIKLDVEGYEREVIKGAWNTISRSRPIIFAEGETDQLFPLLAPLGYVLAGLWLTDSRDLCFLPLLKEAL